MAKPSTDTSAAAPSASLFGEMFDWMLAPFLIVWPLSVAATYLIGVQLANDAFDKTLASQARNVASEIGWNADRNSFFLHTPSKVLLPDDIGEVHLFRIDNDKGENLLGDANLTTLPMGQVPVDGSAVFRTVDFEQAQVRIATIYRPAMNTGAPALPGPVVVYVSETMDRRNALARDIMKGIVIPQFVVIPLMILLMWTGLRRGTVPLERLRARVTARRATDSSPLVVRDAPEEVAPLIVAFNDLLARMEREGEAQRRFIANAAHQLRTPMAGIKMQAELALRGADDADKNGALEKIAAGTGRTAHLVNQLLALARTEGTAADALPMGQMNLSNVVRDAVAAAYPLARAKAIDLGFEAPDQPVLIDGHSELLRELVSNLVDNAIRYTPAGGRVTVRVLTVNGVRLEIEDNGPGIPVGEREHVFERFYRAEGVHESGSGLGLAIVREIAARHAATVTIGDPVGGASGTVFTVAFTRVAQDDQK